jgi:hypothetical protein
MGLLDRAQAAMQVPQPQDWQRHGCCSEGTVVAGHCKNLTQLQACRKNGDIRTACEQRAVCMHTAQTCLYARSSLDNGIPGFGAANVHLAG